MKKILVVLLILAVAGGVFAQEGSWSISGDAVIGARIDFDPIPGSKGEIFPDTVGTANPIEEAALIRSIGYWKWDQTHGAVELAYSLEGLRASLSWNTRNGHADEGASDFDGEGWAEASFNGDNYKFTAVTAVNKLVDKDYQGSISRLWGEYLFLNGLVALEAAYDSRDNGDSTWTSDKSGVFSGLWAGYGKASPAGGIRTQFFHSDPFGNGDTFAAFDHPSILMANVNLDAITFGVQVRGFFDNSNSNGDGSTGIQAWAEYGNNLGLTRLVDDVIKKSIVGLKFNMSPIEVAAQFKMEHAGVYFGGRFFAGPITAGFSFNGLFQGSELADGSYANDKRIKFGADVGFNGGLFGAGVKAYYDRRNDAAVIGDYSTTIGVLPRFSYSAIPSHLGFNVNTGFYFFSNMVGGAQDSSEFIWAVQPELFWNFRGTGAEDWRYWGTSCIMIRYRMVSAFEPAIALKGEGYTSSSWYPAVTYDAANFLDIVFKWNFF
jgi:hypothetical protein